MTNRLLAASVIIVACSSLFAGAYAAEPTPEAAPAPATPGATGAPVNPGVVGALVGDQAKPPEWVKPGVRIVYYSASATLAAANANQPVLVKDPNGDYTAPDGTKYRTESGDAGSSGHGYFIADVLLVDGPHIFVDTKMYVIDGVSGPATLAGGQTVRYDGATGAGLWVHPNELATLKPQLDPEFKILHGPHQIGDARYETVAMGTPKNMTWYDKRSGLRIMQSMKTQSTVGMKAMGTTTPGELRPTGAAVATSLAHQELRQFRMRPMPWTKPTPPPAWMQQTRSVSYRGGQSLTLAGTTVTMPMEMTMELLELGDGWARTRTTLSVRQHPQVPPQTNTVEGYGVIGAVGTIWMDPAVLGQLQDGQVLDREPTVGSILTARRSRGPDGRGHVAITEDGPGFRASNTYDVQSGFMLSSEVLDKAMNTRLWIEYASSQKK